MLKSRKKSPSPPEEWDYRGVDEKELSAALCYEVARYVPCFRDPVIEWHTSRFDGFPEPLLRRLEGVNLVIPAAGVLNKEVVGWSWQIENTAGAMVREFLKSGLPSDFPPPLELRNLATESDRFPEPCMALRSEYRKGRIKNPNPINWGRIVEPPYKVPGRR